AHALGQQGLADAVVDLVGAGVIEIFTLEVDASATGVVGQSFRVVKVGGPADVFLEIVLEQPLKFRVAACFRIFFGELAQRLHERFRDVAAAVGTEPAVNIGNAGCEGGHGG